MGFLLGIEEPGKLPECFGEGLIFKFVDALVLFVGTRYSPLLGGGATGEAFVV